MEIWDKQLLECKSNVDRALLARSYECHHVLLKAFCYDDLDPLVVEEAALNPYSEEHWVKRALVRFPLLDTPSFWEARENNIAKLQKEIEKKGSMIVADRDQMILKHILRKPADNVFNHLGTNKKEITDIQFKNPIVEWADTSKYRVAMIMAPAWGVIFPPYNLAKLTSILRKFDYSTKVYDLNIESYHLLKDMDPSVDYWASHQYYYWMVKENFQIFLLPKLKPLFDKVINELVESNPRVIGFSVYNTNLWATDYLVKEIKRKLPDACVIVGGPEVTSTGKKHSFFKMNWFNYLFVGEAEETLPSVLENLPDVLPMHQYIGTTDSKIRLEDYPYTDYSDYNLSNYRKDNGVSMETSRGCVADCSFCAETAFWKFRSNDPERVINEIQHLYDTKKIKHIWFVDSLINGNLKVFEKIVDLLIERDLGIEWNCYARCDGRMTKELIAKVVKSGCSSLSYGVESGSQKVLHDMRKKVEIWEIENNLRDGREVGLDNHVNWMVGYPTEEPIDFYHSLVLLANCRMWIGAISPGFTVGIPEDSHLQTDWKTYNIAGVEYPGDMTLLNSWHTVDYTNTVLHRLVRLKMLHVWLDIIDIYAGSIIDNGYYNPEFRNFYKAKLNDSKKERIEYDEYVNLNRLDTSELKNSVANEYFTFAYILYNQFGAGTFELYYNPELDLPIFGNTLVHNYNATFKFEVDEEGNYTLSLNHTFKHEALSEHLTPIIEGEKKRIGDKSFVMSYTDSGNLHDWVVEEKQMKETVHLQYRNKKKVIPITSSRSS